MPALMKIVRPMITGLLAVLPVFITLFVVGWVANTIAEYLGPESAFGELMAQLGAQVVDDRLAYVIGLVFAFAGLYLIGLLVQTRLRNLWNTFMSSTIGRIPLIGTIYTTIARFVQLLEKQDDVDVQSMSPVWCFFSDEKRTAVLGLLASNERIEVEGETYRVVMVPTAPVPFGGGLFFLPEEWVKAAPFGVEGLTNIYVSMGVTAPDYLRSKDAKKPPTTEGTERVPGMDHPRLIRKSESVSEGEGNGEGEREEGGDRS